MPHIISPKRIPTSNHRQFRFKSSFLVRFLLISYQNKVKFWNFYKKFGLITIKLWRFNYSMQYTIRIVNFNLLFTTRKIYFMIYNIFKIKKYWYWCKLMRIFLNKHSEAISMKSSLIKLSESEFYHINRKITMYSCWIFVPIILLVELIFCNPPPPP